MKIEDALLKLHAAKEWHLSPEQVDRMSDRTIGIWIESERLIREKADMDRKTAQFYSSGGR